MSNWRELSNSLEEYLGDPFNAMNCHSFASIIEKDEYEVFPQTLVDSINKWGFSEFYIPWQLGGRFRSFEEIKAVVEVVARRDLTAAIAHSACFLGSSAVWLAGSDEQKSILAGMLRNNEVVAFGMSERDHGSDLLGNELNARKSGDSYILTGEKWLINNANRSTSIVVLARTDNKIRERGLSLFFVSKGALHSSNFSLIPKLRSTGLRGSDLGGFNMRDCSIQAKCLVGSEGEGLEISLKILQVSRTLCGALSLGAANSAFDVAFRFARNRILYGRPIADIPVVRSVLVSAYIDILICDCMTHVAARGLHTSTDQFSVWSAVVKYFVPATVESVISRLGSVIGARHYLRDGEQGVFQKIMRDNAVVSIFDGNSMVNLYAIAAQLAFLPILRPSSVNGLACSAKDRLLTLFDLSKELPVFDYSNLSLFNHGQDDVVIGVEDVLTMLMRWSADGRQEQNFSMLIANVRHLLDMLKEVGERAGELTKDRRSIRQESPHLYDLAIIYSRCHAAAACLQLWMHSRHVLDPGLQSVDWLVLALQRLLHKQADYKIPDLFISSLYRKILQRQDCGEYVGIMPVGRPVSPY